VTAFRYHGSKSLLYRLKLIIILPCYPKGNFEENQLLGSSMSLSPLYSTLSINLRVRMQNGPPSIFLSTSTWSRIAHCLSGLYNLTLRNSEDGSKLPSFRTEKLHVFNKRSFLLLSLRVQVSTHFYPRQIVKLLSPCYKTGDSKEFNDNDK